jgi:hypothetical protein
MCLYFIQNMFYTQYIRYCRDSDYFDNFMYRWLLFMQKLLNQACLVVQLKSSLRNVYGRHHDLTLRMLVSQMMFIWWCLTPLGLPLRQIDNICGHLWQDSSWPWSHGSWIYNYLCNQCLPPLMFCVRISIMAKCTTLCVATMTWRYGC